MTLRAEFEQTLRASQNVTGVHLAALESATWMMEEARAGGAPGAPIQVPDTLLYRFFYATTMNPSTGALDAALAGGRLGLIESADLREASASWPGALLDATTDESDAAAESMRMIRTGFERAGDLSHISEHLTSFVGGTLTADRVASTTRLSGTTELVGDIGVRIVWLQTVLEAHRTLQRRTEAVLALLRTELQRG